MFEALQFIKASNEIKHSQILKETKLGLNKKRLIADFRGINKTLKNQMPPPKKIINPSSDSHDSNFALVNYESSQQTIDEHTEVENNTFSLSRLHWTDSLEIILVGAAALFLIRYVRKFLKKRRQREEAQRQAQLVSTLQESIPMNNTVFPSAPVPMLEDKSLQNTRGTRPPSFRLYQP